MYKVVGADGREYGPVTREALLEWIAQGRANGETIVKFEDGAWKPLRTFDEFKEVLGVPAQLAPPREFTTFPSSDAPPFSGIGSRQETNVASVIGLVASICCCCCCYVGPSIGILFSLIGWSQIRSNPQRYSTSDALPKIGLAISIFVLLLHILNSILESKISRNFPQFPFNI